MSIDTQDPRLTSYALGEMSTLESTAFEAELATDPAALAEVETIRSMAGAVQAELQAEDAPALAPEQRAAITNAKPRRPIYQMWLPWATIAASIVVLVALPALLPGAPAGDPADDLYARGTAANAPLDSQWRTVEGRKSAPTSLRAADPNDALTTNGANWSRERSVAEGDTTWAAGTGPPRRRAGT